MSVIKNGKFYPDKEPEPLKSSSEWKRWNHMTQRADHQEDILQRTRGGKPNGEWIRSFPEEAKIQYDEQIIRKFGNEY